jgi:hypothetical protein
MSDDFSEDALVENFPVTGYFQERTISSSLSEN